MKRILKDYFTFSKKERAAISILLLLIAFFIAAPYFYSAKIKPPVLNKALNDFLKNKTIAANDSAHETGEPLRDHTASYTPSKKGSFAFDPNTVSEQDWKRLGVTDKTIRTILTYRNKGGKFKSPEDLRKIWGFKKADADRLVPFVRIATIPAIVPSQKNAIGNKKPETGKPIPIDINIATPEQWRSLPGIGDVLADRIIKFRERTGGFTSTEPVRKTYGISDSVFKLISPYLIVDPLTAPKLDLNNVSAYDLKIKTGVPDAVAKAIIVYRQQYGAYHSVNDLKKIVFISDSLFQKIAPFLKTE